MKRRDAPRIIREQNESKHVARTGFKSLAELRMIIRIVGELSARLGIPLPKRLRREAPEKDAGSEP